MRMTLPSTVNPSEPPKVPNALEALQRKLNWLSGSSAGKQMPLIISNLDYLMALFSQVAYVPTRFEATNRRATSVVPSSFFRKQVALGRSLDIALLVGRAFPAEEGVQVQQVETGNSVTSLVKIRNVVIIASRGTAFFHEVMRPFRDVAIDLDAWHIPYGNPLHRYHFGFLEEASASLPHIRVAYEAICAGSPLPIYFTGHSLGGALSAVMDRLWETNWPREKRTTIVFGCPRFGNRATVDLRPVRSLERKGDPVPRLPPKFLGYANANSRVPLVGPDPISRLRLMKNHAMERYRRAVADREKILAEDALLYRLFEIAMAKDPKRWNF